MTRWHKYSLLIALLATVLVIVGLTHASRDYFSNYLCAIFFFISVALGALGNAMIQELTGGAWGSALRPVLVPAIKTIPVLALMFIPVLFGLQDIYPWVGDHSLVPSAWLNPTAFKVRTLVYLLVWTALSLYFGDARADRRRTRNASAFGLIVYGFTISLASIDWIMSLIPQWYSTVFGLLIGITQLLAGLSFAICIFLALQSHRSKDQGYLQLLNDFGNLLLMYVLSWMYLAFTQYLIIWAADLPREISWYLPRLNSNWRWLLLLVVVLQFGLPFLLLLSRDLKRRSRYLLAIAATCLIGQWLYIFQLVLPSIYIKGIHIGWSTLLTTITVGSWWILALQRHLPSSIDIRNEEVSHDY